MNRKIFLILLAFMHLIAGAQDSTRPKVGLVLSGGGAKGLAHIGVIRVLEEAGLQADVVTGTSMGSIIGALHAIGYSGEDLSKVNQDADWDILLTNDIPFNRIFLPEKYNYERFLFDLPVTSDGVAIPDGMIDGQELSLLFSRLTFRTAGTQQFDDYPLPFRCVASDIVHAEPVVFKNGDLATAMRASMAIPSVFSPVLLDSNTLLVDGGVYRNFPAQEALDLGADYLIGVYVGFPDKVEADELKGIASILTRTTLLSGTKDVHQQTELIDYIIYPDLEGFSTGSFGKGIEIEEKGEESARSHLPRLKEISDSLNRLGPPAVRKKLAQEDSVWITEIRINHLNHTSEEFILKKSGLKPGMWVTPDILDEAVNLVHGTLYFEKITYQFNPLPGGMQLVLNVRERPRTHIKAGIHWDNYFGIGVILGFSRHNFLMKGSKLNIIGDISKYPQFRIDYNKYFGVKQNLYASLYTRGDYSKLPVYENKEIVGVAREDYFSAGLAFNYVLRTNNRFGLGLQYRLSNLRPDESLRLIYPIFGLFDKIGFHATDVRAQYEHNTLNSNIYPTVGLKAFVEVMYVYTGKEYLTFEQTDSTEIGDTHFDVKPFWRMSASIENYLPFGDKWTLETGADLGLASGDVLLTDAFYLGGYRYNLRRRHVPFLGYGVDQLQERNFFKLRAGIQHELVSGLFTGIMANYMLASDDYNRLFNGDTFSDGGAHHLGLGGGVTFKSPLGPLSVWLGTLANEWTPTWYLNFGYTF